MLDQLLQLVFNGLVTGAILAIGAIGASLVWGVLRIGNFAHGDYMALGAFVAFTFNVPLGQSLVVSALAGILATSAFAILAHQLVLKPMAGRGLTSVFIVTVGLAFVMRNTLFLVFGSSTRSFNMDQAAVLVAGPVRMSPGQLATIAAAFIGISGFRKNLAEATWDVLDARPRGQPTTTRPGRPSATGSSIWIGRSRKARMVTALSPRPIADTGRSTSCPINRRS